MALLQTVKGFGQFISIERGFMLFAIAVAATLLVEDRLGWAEAVYVGLIVLLGWSAADAMNNLCDIELDEKSDPFRASYTRNLGKLGFILCLGLGALTLVLAIASNVPLVIAFILLGIVAGIMYSVPPFRLRQTVYKPLVNFSVGAIPVLIAAAFSGAFSSKIWSLVFLIGVTTAVNSLWEDMADYASDLHTGARTMPIVLGIRRGLFVTVVAGYCLVPLMVLVGVMFQLNILYYLILSALGAYVSYRLIRERSVLLGKDTDAFLGLGKILAKDFVILAIIHTTNLMLSAYLRYQEFPWF